MKQSCTSSQNDDEEHFTAPWAYPGDRAEAMRRLVAVATGEARYLFSPFGQMTIFYCFNW